jgi:hypothetical protein
MAMLIAVAVILAGGWDDSSDDERNRTAREDTPFARAVSTPEESTTAGAAAPANRRNCDLIRDTTYASDEERDWYLANCLRTTASAVTVAAPWGGGATPGATSTRQAATASGGATSAPTNRPPTATPRPVQEDLSAACAPRPFGLGTPGVQTQESIAGVAVLMPDGISALDRERIGQGLLAGKAYVDRHLSPIRQDVCFDVRLNDARNGSAGIYTAKSIIVMFTDVGGWRGPSQPWHQAKVAAHEYVHVWQSDLMSGIPRDEREEANWLLEGIAEYAGYQAVIEAGIVGSTQARSYLMALARGTQSALESYEERPPDAPQVSYSLVYLAVEYLANTSAGTNALWSFYNAIGRGEPWRTAFQTAFGRSVGDFYNEFEEYRSNGFQ